MIGINVMEYDPEEVRKKIHAPKKSSSYEICEAITQEIARIRKYNHMSQQEIADRSGVKQQMIARFESGINTPNMSMVLKLLTTFGKTLYIDIDALKNVELEDSEDSAVESEEADRTAG